jgi:DNA-binding MarR family transcriptional regulator
MNQLEDCISFLLGKAYQQVSQAARQQLAPYGVTPIQYAVLDLLWERDAQSSAELGGRLQLDSATMTGVLDRLGQTGLIERRSDSHDRRVNRVFLTPQAQALEEPLKRVADALNDEFFGRFDKKDADRLREMLIILGNVKMPRRDLKSDTRKK